jgi:hypothetical protein|tara:strand:+ start:3025 stop:3366 length:342 start_codon:yes stop_codon:yes gene_type:complete
MADKNKWQEPSEKLTVHVPQSQKAKLKIRLHHDGLTQASFLRGVVSAYLQEQEEFMHWFSSWLKTNSKIKGKLKHLDSQKLNQEGKEIEKKFGINDGDIDDIFDIIQQEFPDL